VAAEWADPHAGQADHDPGTQLPRYRIIEHTLTADSSAIGRPLGELPWPPGHLPVSILHHRRLIEPASGLRLTAGDRVHLLAPLPDQRHRGDSATTRNEPS
jgi:CIC family chloride channel protein